MASIVSHIRKLIGNRRQQKRRKADLLLTVSVITGNPSADITRRTAALAGLTHDLSASHLAINVPTIRLGDRYLTAPDSILQIVLDLPKEKIEFQGTAVRYEKQVVGDGGKSYLIAVKIRRMSEGAHRHYQEYLSTLK